MESSQKLYVYTKRRARVDGKSQFVELVPKLYGTFYNLYDADSYIKQYVEKEKQQIEQKYDTFMNIINYNLDKSTYIDKISNITPEEKDKIKELNREKIGELMIDDNNKLLKDAFIEHLHRGHGDSMQYGLYFSMIYAKDDEDFRIKNESNYKTNTRR
jgi:hypothetical protein